MKDLMRPMRPIPIFGLIKECRAEGRKAIGH